MGNVLRVFARDVKRLITVPPALLVVIALIVLPSLYTWFNVAGFWNPYDNTESLRVCVVNEDAGVVNDTLGNLDLGSQLEDQLRKNDQLGWAFMSREEAMDEVRSGKAFAAFVIPESFSADVATIVSGELKQPTIEYYVNEKKGPVSPKITDTGANSLDTTINDTFFSTVSATVAEALNEKALSVESKLGAAKDRASERVGKAVKSIAGARESLSALAEDARAAAGTADEVRASLAEADAQIQLVSEGLAQTAELLGDVNSSVVKFSASMGSTLDEGSSLLGQSSAQTALSINKVTGAVTGVTGDVDAAAARAQAVIDENEAIASELEQLKDVIATAGSADGQAGQPAIDTSGLDRVISQIRSIDGEAQADLNALTTLSSDISSLATSTAQASTSVDAAVQSALPVLEGYRATLADSTIPALSADIQNLTSTANSLSGTVAGQKSLVGQASSAAGQFASTLTTSANALQATSDLLKGFEDDLAGVQTDLQALQVSNALKELTGRDGIDPDTIADFMKSPTQVQTVELYELNAYGTAMAPLFINMTLWIGVFMLMVILKLEVDDEGVKRLTITQRFFGRWIFLAILSALQAIVCCTGCLAMGVQTVNAPLFYATAIGASLAYLSLQYTLSTTLQHVGKALCIVLIFVQIPAATGLYPVEMTNDFFQRIYPLFPFTYGINAIRETTCGFYGSDWYGYMGMLFLFFTVFLAIGVVLRPYTTNLNRMFARQIEESDIINGEEVELPARRYRMSQIIRAMSDREDFREGLERRAASFMRFYARLKLSGLVGGIVVPVVLTAVLVGIGMNKVVVLTSWLIWFVLVVAFLIVVEYVRDYLSHEMSLDAMSDEEVRTLFARRDSFTLVKPLDVRRREKSKQDVGRGEPLSGDPSPSAQDDRAAARPDEASDGNTEPREDEARDDDVAPSPDGNRDDGAVSASEGIEEAAR